MSQRRGFWRAVPFPPSRSDTPTPHTPPTLCSSHCSQEYFRSREWVNKPIRCEPCRKARKAQDTRGGGGYNSGYGGQQGGAFGGGAFGSRGGGGGGQGGGRSCYNCGKVRCFLGGHPWQLPFSLTNVPSRCS